MNMINLEDLKHGIRVARYSSEVAMHINYYMSKGDRLEKVYLSGVFHDIGKAYIDQDILNKPGKLTYQERLAIQKHPLYSYTEIKKLGFSHEIATNILHHHENFGGTGYPDHLKGTDIPIGARILKICDVFDALLMKRPYRDALSIEDAFLIMDSERENYDPFIYDIFISSVLYKYKICHN